MIPEIMGWERVWPWLLGAFLVGFALGSVPVAVLVSRALGLPDPRSYGSRNVGASNVLRSGHKGAALLVLGLDFLKGWLPAVIGFLYLGPVAAACAGLGAFLGHCFSPLLRFRGGKGVASGAGALFGWVPLAGLAGLIGWLAMVSLTRRSSLGAFAAASAGMLALALLDEWTYFWAFALMSLVMLIQHRANIRRLLRGEEPKISLGKRS
ncbi:MAG: glycerol-3-phosphate 1-O-acyltransferase PlsY [Neomegalonema sp.]|nr:glycerol-3-phosphate 1-O-acyltransferase PlsY [Neomegalonema sp.]